MFLKGLQGRGILLHVNRFRKINGAFWRRSLCLKRS